MSCEAVCLAGGGVLMACLMFEVACVLSVSDFELEV